MRLKEEYREETVINRSRFIACAKPCFTEEEARSYIAQIQKENPDATHVCTAYALGENNKIRRSSDNKEPSGTAGVPMLESILRSGLENTCVCVVRYFGGIKLGAGGLIRAYSGSVADCLAHGAKVEKVPMVRWLVSYPYDLSGSIEGWIRRNCELEDIEYGEEAAATFVTDKENIPDIIRDISKGKCEALLIEHTFKEIDVTPLQTEC